MGEQYIKELCDERHQAIASTLKSIDDKMDKLSGRLNWFYVVSITMLLGSLIAAKFGG